MKYMKFTTSVRLIGVHGIHGFHKFHAATRLEWNPRNSQHFIDCVDMTNLTWLVVFHKIHKMPREHLGAPCLRWALARPKSIANGP